MIISISMGHGFQFAMSVPCRVPGSVRAKKSDAARYPDTPGCLAFGLFQGLGFSSPRCLMVSDGYPKW